MTKPMASFADWLTTELETREWSQSELARRAGVSTAAVSDILSGRRNVGTELATAIADALKIPQDDVYIAAGLLRPKRDRNSIIEQIIHEVQERPEAEQREFLSYIRFMNNQRKKK
jgi:transcriptional regulator with XRE-family HTH domain